MSQAGLAFAVGWHLQSIGDIEAAKISFTFEDTEHARDGWHGRKGAYSLNPSSERSTLMLIEPVMDHAEQQHHNGVNLEVLARDITIPPPQGIPAALVKPATPDTAVLRAAADANQRIEEAITLLRSFQDKLNSDAAALAANLSNYTTTAGRLADLFRVFVDEQRDGTGQNKPNGLNLSETPELSTGL